MFSHEVDRQPGSDDIQNDIQDTGFRREFEVYEGPLRNPERGLMQALDIFSPSDILFVQSVGVSLGVAQINLARFRARPLSKSFLSELSAGFSNVREAGLKLVLRFEYDTIGGQDAPLARVLAHIDQLAPLLQENSDVIAVLQAGFVGAWGEWHSSKHGLDSAKSRHAILARLLEVLPEGRKVQVRSPVYKEQALQFAAAHDSKRLAAERIGYHNDCLLADQTDQGTYPAPGERWRAYVENDRADVPVGGETCKANAPSTHCGHAIYELRHQRWSFVNRTYHPEVIATWKKQGCLGIIARDLGYRFALKNYDFPATMQAGSEAALHVELENLGYAVPFNARPVLAVLSGSKGRFEMALDGWDPTAWKPDGATSLEAVVAIPADVPAGTYSLSLWLPDPMASLRNRPAYAIQMANEEVWDSNNGLNLLGEVRVE